MVGFHIEVSLKRQLRFLDYILIIKDNLKRHKINYYNMLVNVHFLNMHQIILHREKLSREKCLFSK